MTVMYYLFLFLTIVEFRGITCREIMHCIKLYLTLNLIQSKLIEIFNIISLINLFLDPCLIKL